MHGTARILYVLRCLQEQTDEHHPISTKQILDYLEAQGISANRRTIPGDIEALMEYGVDVVEVKSTQNLYFIGERHFQLPELKLLIDAVQASKFLTEKHSKALIGKLLSLASPHQSADLTDSLHLEHQVKPQNEAAYITADLLFTAIRKKKRVRFMYYEYGPDKKKTYKHGRRIYTFSPWGFLWDNEKYYIIGYSDKHEKAVTFRVDRIAAPKLTEMNAISAPDGFNLADYGKSVFQMFDGPMLDVTLKCKNELMKTIIDRFGEGVQTKIADHEHFYAKVSVSVSKTFYGWIFGLDGAAEIVAPAEAMKDYCTMLERANPYAVTQSR